MTIEDVLGKSDDVGSGLAPVWGTHWVYRCIAEYISVTIGAFVAGGIARGRAKAGAIVGSLAVSLLYAFQVGAYLYFSQYLHTEVPNLTDPWYQTIIDGLMILAAPMVAAVTVEHIEDSHRLDVGLVGVNRWHFVWLWVLAYFYAILIITPVARFYSIQMSGGTLVILVSALVNSVPAFALLIPLYYGLSILSGRLMATAARNLVGPLVLIGGLVVGFPIQYGWYWMFEKISSAIFE